MKKIILPVILLAICCIGGYYYYYHNYVETVNEIFLVRFYPPITQYDENLDTFLSKPDISCSKTGYTDDSLAVRKTTEDMESFLKGAEKEYKQAMDAFLDDASMSNRIKVNACAVVFSEMRYLVSFTHTLNYNPQEVMDHVLKKKLSPKETREYAGNKGLSVRVYEIQ